MDGGEVRGEQAVDVVCSLHRSGVALLEQVPAHTFARMGMVANLLAVSPGELEHFRRDPEALQALLAHPVDGLRVAYLDKSWEGLLFLLTGRGLAAQERSDTNPGRALFSGQLLIQGHQDVGPAHYLDALQVAAVARELSQIVPATLAERYDPDEMTLQNIYPMLWNRGGSELRDYLLDYFDELKIQYIAAKEKGQAMICFLGEEAD